MIGGIILSHGQMAQAIVDSSRAILGESERLYALSCNGLSREALHEKISRLIESESLKDGVFIFVGLKGGSCWNVGAKIVEEMENVEVISGVNIAIILSFLMKRRTHKFTELGQVLVNDAVRGICRCARKKPEEEVDGGTRGNP